MGGAWGIENATVCWLCDLGRESQCPEESTCLKDLPVTGRRRADSLIHAARNVSLRSIYLSHLSSPSSACSRISDLSRLCSCVFAARYKKFHDMAPVVTSKFANKASSSVCRSYWILLSCLSITLRLGLVTCIWFIPPLNASSHQDIAGPLSIATFLNWQISLLKRSQSF